MQPFPRSATNLRCLLKICVFTNACDNLKQPKPAGAGTQASKQQQAEAEPEFGAELSSITQLGPI